jgi:hypothetical protein
MRLLFLAGAFLFLFCCGLGANGSASKNGSLKGSTWGLAGGAVLLPFTTSNCMVLLLIDFPIKTQQVYRLK